MQCLLCKSDTKLFIKIKEREFYRCEKCYSIMLSPINYLNKENEKLRYEEHNNDVFDKRYQDFVSPIVNAVLKDFEEEHKGLDFGSGTGPVITKMLKDQDYDIEIYDPFFANDKEKLYKSYDYIVCCEVMEHFHNPRLEFKRLKNMLNNKGYLYLKTKVYNENIDFESWYYKDDPTHVFFYHLKGLEFIREYYGFSMMKNLEDMIIYKT